MTNNTKATRGCYKPAELRGTEKVLITPLQKGFIEKKHGCSAGVYIRRMLDELMVKSAAEGISNDCK